MKARTVISIILTILFLSIGYASAETTWCWTEVTQDTMNNPITVTEYQLYCNGKEPRIILAPEICYTYNPPVGAEVTCYVTAVSNIGVPSLPSNTVTKIISDDGPPQPQEPKPPILSDN